MIRIYITLVCLLLIHTTASAQSENIIYHPDGIVGRLNGYLQASYSTAATVPDNLVNDKSYWGAGLIFPAAKYITLETGISLESGDTSFYDYTAGIKLYSRNPSLCLAGGNPDGISGAPIVRILFNGKFPDRNLSNHQYNIRAEILIPISGRFSIGCGGRYYERENSYQVDNF